MLRITKIRLIFGGVVPAGSMDTVNKVLGFYAKACPAYQSVKGCIDVSWTSELTEANAAD